MTTTIRFHLDEHVDHDVARGLRSRGIDVTTAVDARLCAASDESHIAFAFRDGRVIFTNDADFSALDRQGVPHSGIVYCAVGTRSVGEIVRYLCLLHDCLDAEEMIGRVEFC